MLRFGCSNVLDEPVAGWIAVEEVARNVGVVVVRKPFGDEILANHVEQVLPFDGLGMLPSEIRNAAELHDAFGEAVDVVLLVNCVLQEFLGSGPGPACGRQAAMPSVTL